jgi:prevent-host-death family protein
MQSIQASEAKTHFLRVLDDVERGESILITRRGKAVARIAPVRESKELRRERTERAMQAIEEIRKRTKPTTVEEILSARDEGRR